MRVHEHDLSENSLVVLYKPNIYKIIYLFQEGTHNIKVIFIKIRMI